MYFKQTVLLTVKQPGAFLGDVWSFYPANDIVINIEGSGAY